MCLLICFYTKFSLALIFIKSISIPTRKSNDIKENFYSKSSWSCCEKMKNSQTTKNYIFTWAIMKELRTRWVYTIVYNRNLNENNILNKSYGLPFIAFTI